MAGSPYLVSQANPPEVAPYDVIALLERREKLDFQVDDPEEMRILRHLDGLIESLIDYELWRRSGSQTMRQVGEELIPIRPIGPTEADRVRSLSDYIDRKGISLAETFAESLDLCRNVTRFWSRQPGKGPMPRVDDQRKVRDMLLEALTYSVPGYELRDSLAA